MTKAQSETIRKALNHTYKCTFISKSGSMSVRVYSYINNAYNATEEAQEIENALNMIPDIVCDYEIKHRTYQGFIHDTCIIFS